MFKSHSREKLINAILFFAEQTRRHDKRKLLGLLYLLDFEHFNQTGHSVTGLEYAAWRHGPVPIDFFAEWDNPERDLAEAIGEPWERSGAAVKLKKRFDDQYYSRRELTLMQRLAEEYADASADEVSERTRNRAWHKVWDDGVGGGQVIDYAFAITDENPHREELLGIAREYAATMPGVGKRLARQRHHA